MSRGTSSVVFKPSWAFFACFACPRRAYHQTAHFEFAVDGGYIPSTGTASLHRGSLRRAFYPYYLFPAMTRAMESIYWALHESLSEHAPRRQHPIYAFRIGVVDPVGVDRIEIALADMIVNHRALLDALCLG
jgi:hypothetical protein